MSASTSGAYKARKEAFVSNLSGSSLIDINLVTLVAPSAILLWTALQKRQSFFTPTGPMALAVDFLLNVCAILSAFTVYSSAPVLLNILLAVPAIFLLLPLLPAENSTRRNNKKDAAKMNEAAKIASSKIPNRPFITHYRGAMMIATCMAILAVDFPVFPRRFAKVETWGTSLMDLGVGSFVFSAGVVSARQVLTLTTSSQSTCPSILQRLLSSLRHSVPLLILGLIRLYTVKGLDYAEHVTEYGVHWNFFFTLGLLPPFIELSDTLIHHVFRSYDVLAILVAITYELILNNTSLLRYILISPRGPDLLSKNREGVFSFIGYLSIFLSGRGIGTRILPFHPHPQSHKLKQTTTTTTIIDPLQSTRKDRQKVLLNLLLTSALYTLLFTLSTNYYTFNLRISRRLANAPYTFWIAAFNNAQILLFALIEHVGPKFSFSFSSSSASTTPSTATKDPTGDSSGTTSGPETATSSIMASFNCNGLAIFLAANLMTGLVNLTFNTLDASNAVAMGVLIGYAAVVTGVAVGLSMSGIRIKL